MRVAGPSGRTSKFWCKHHPPFSLATALTEGFR
jgi:hypothetical protein